MSSVIVDRVVVHGDNGSIMVTRDRQGRYYLEARAATWSGGRVRTQGNGPDKIVVKLNPDVVVGDGGLIDQMVRFSGHMPEAEEPDEGIAELLSRVMDEQGLTAKEVAYTCGVSSAAVYFWRCGKSRPSPDRAQQLAAALGLPVEVVKTAMGRNPEGVSR